MSATIQPSTADAQPAQPPVTVLVAGARDVFDTYDSKYDSDKRLCERDRGRIVARALYAAGVPQSAVSEVVHGANEGSPDIWGAAWAAQTDTDVRPFKPDWDDLSHPDAYIKEGKYGPYDARAGPRRNEEMADYVASTDGPSLLVAFWDGESRGTSSMISLARSRDIPVFTIRLDREGEAAAIVGGL